MDAAAVAQALEIAEDGWRAAEESAKCAVALQERCEQLMTDKLRLEKVAASKQALDPETISKTLDILCASPKLQIGDREKLAAALREDPNRALDLVARLAILSSAPRPEGQGVAKIASAGNPVAGYVQGKAVKADPHGFHRVILEGAN